MREVDEPHDAEDQRQAGGVERIEPAEQDALDEVSSQAVMRGVPCWLRSLTLRNLPLEGRSKSGQAASIGVREGGDSTDAVAPPPEVCRLLRIRKTSTSPQGGG